MYGNDLQRVPISGLKKFLLLASFSIQCSTFILSFFQEELNPQIAGEIYLNQLISSSKFDLHFPHTSSLYIHTRSFCSSLSFGPRGPSCAMLKSYKPVILFCHHVLWSIKLNLWRAVGSPQSCKLRTLICRCLYWEIRFSFANKWVAGKFSLLNQCGIFFSVEDWRMAHNIFIIRPNKIKQKN